MFERRPIWGLIVGLNVCILIWLISVQESVMYDTSTAALSSSNNYVINAATGAGSGSQVPATLITQQRKQQQQDQQQQQQQQQYGIKGWGRDLLSKRAPSAQANEYVEDVSGAASTFTTLTFSNNNSSTTNTSTKQSTTAGTQTFPSSLNLSALPVEDFNQLIDLHNFRFLTSQPVCGTHIEALILIHSAPNNHEKRQVIRETWASTSDHSNESPLRILFLLGAVNSEQLQTDLEHENYLHSDIIQGSFIDDYRNMTYKHVMAFKWFIYNCPQAQILIKVDDDVYVNTPQLRKYLKEQQQSQQKGTRSTNMDNPTTATTATLNQTTVTTNSTTTNTTAPNTITPTQSTSIFDKLNIFGSAAPSVSAASTASTASTASSQPTFNVSQQLFNHPQNLLFCQKIIGALVKRSYRSKWRVSFTEYSGHYYPPYCPGYAIIYSADIIVRLYTAAQHSKYFWIDDVHITGVLAQQTNTTITTSSHYVLFSGECDEILTGKTDLSKTEFLFAWHSISPHKIQLLWHLQMMSMHTLDDLPHNKSPLSDVYDAPHQRLYSSNDDEYFGDNVNGISSDSLLTSANGFR